MDWQETIADIIREKRLRADEIERDVAEKMKRGEMTSDQYARELVADIRREADRLEAAHKRESGDRAKLREFARLVSHMNDDGYWDGTASIWALVCKAKAALAEASSKLEAARKEAEAVKAWGAFTADDLARNHRV